MSNSELYKRMKQLHYIESEQNFNLEVFGDFIAQREKYKTKSGMDALYFYLIQKYHWKPFEVKALSNNDLRFLLSEEMDKWDLPEDARNVYKNKRIE